MADSVTILDVVAMLGLFFAAFFLWVSWEMITGQKALALPAMTGLSAAVHRATAPEMRSGRHGSSATCPHSTPKSR